MECVFESDFEKCLCNDSCLYKNPYKELYLLKMFKFESVGVKNVFVVSKRVTMSILPTQKV